MDSPADKRGNRPRRVRLVPSTSIRPPCPVTIECGDRQTEPGPLADVLGREERIEDARQAPRPGCRGRCPRSRSPARRRRRRVPGQRCGLPSGPRHHRRPAERVGEQIEQHLADLRRYARDDRRRRVRLLDLDAAPLYVAADDLEAGGIDEVDTRFTSCRRGGLGSGPCRGGCGRSGSPGSTPSRVRSRAARSRVSPTRRARAKSSSSPPSRSRTRPGPPATDRDSRRSARTISMIAEAVAAGGTDEIVVADERQRVVDLVSDPGGEKAAIDASFSFWISVAAQLRCALG